VNFKIGNKTATIKGRISCSGLLTKN